MDLNILAIVISGISAAIAIASFIWAICSARSSKKLAEAANTKADTANTLSTEANKLSEEALTVSKRTEARQTDTSNIHWEGNWSAVGVWTITNKGDDEALDVRFIVSFNGEEIRDRRDRVPGGGSFDIKFPEAVNQYREDVRELERLAELRRRSPIGIAPPFNNYHTISERIDWTTTTGRPGFHEERFPLVLLVDPGGF